MTGAKWKRAFLPPAHRESDGARNLLVVALQDLESSMVLHTRDAATRRYILLDSGTRNVEQAWMCLSTSMTAMVASELVALRACATVPTEPVASVSLLRDGTDARHDVWLALFRLQSAREYGQDALPRIEAAYGHLRAAQFMIARLPPAAGRAAAMVQVQAAVDQIHSLRGSLHNMAALVSFASEPAIRIKSS